MSFSITGMPQIEKRIRNDLARIILSILSVTGNRTMAVILTGGYGRGEGGVILRNEEILPVNDYDLVVVVRDSSLYPFSRLRSRVRQLSGLLAEEIGVGVDIAVIRENALPFVKPTIFWYETRMGHQVLWGNPNALDAVPKFDATDIPLEEGARLLLNRGAMLLDAMARVNGNGHISEADIVRILTAGWKAALSWGDCVLLKEGKYHYSHRARESTFVGLRIQNGVPYKEQLKGMYQEAVWFKFFPGYESPPNEDISAWVNSIVQVHEGIFRWFEENRLARPFPHWAKYASPRVPKFPFSLDVSQLGKNFIQSLWSCGWPELGSLSRWTITDPQERLVSTLPLLLFTPNSENLEWCSRALGLKGRGEIRVKREVVVRRFLELWH